MSIAAITLAFALNAAPPAHTAGLAVDPAQVPAQTSSEPVAPGAQAPLTESDAAPAVDPTQPMAPPAAASMPAADSSAGQSSPAPVGAPAAPTTQPPPTLPTPTANPASAPASGGEIVVVARQPTPEDPLLKLNLESYQVIQSVDRAVIAPITMGYKSVMPKPVRLGLRNFLRNLEEPVIALNFLLQLKPGRAAKSVGRFAVNSTMGIGGLIDVAKTKPFNLPYVPNGFANTLACYGVGPGPYFFLPLVGPTTLRDVIGVSLDRLAVPAAVGKPFDRPYYAIPANVIDSLNDRIDIDDQLKQIRENSDPYTATRELYLKQRKSEIAAICPKKGEAVDKTLPPRPGKGRD